MTDKLPELPESDCFLCFYDEGGMQEAAGTAYTADHLRFYAAEAVRLEREACALECDRMVSATAVSYETGSACAAAIRARSEL